MNTAYRN